MLDMVLGHFCLKLEVVKRCVFVCCSSVGKGKEGQETGDRFHSETGGDRTLLRLPAKRPCRRVRRTVVDLPRLKRSLGRITTGVDGLPLDGARFPLRGSRGALTDLQPGKRKLFVSCCGERSARTVDRAKLPCGPSVVCLIREPWTADAWRVDFLRSSGQEAKTAVPDVVCAGRETATTPCALRCFFIWTKGTKRHCALCGEGRELAILWPFWANWPVDVAELGSFVVPVASVPKTKELAPRRFYRPVRLKFELVSRHAHVHATTNTQEGHDKG